MSTAIFMRAQWRNLAMLNFEIDPAILAPLIPRGVELDDSHGRTLISLVAFEFTRARLLGMPVPFHQHFPEMNLRCYVRRRIGDEIRHGVFFLKEIVPKRAVVFVANRMFNESFTFAPITHTRRENGETFDARLGGGAARLQFSTSGELRLPTPDSEEVFVLERYHAYNTTSRGETLEFHVEHTPWRVLPARIEAFEIDADRIYGPEFAAALRRAPTSVFVADGSEVSVHRGTSISSSHERKFVVGPANLRSRLQSALKKA